MKINNELIVLDLEATSNQEEEGERPDVQENNDIIDIGAVIVSKSCEFQGTNFSALVKPETPITPFITGLTGITNEMVENEPKWDVVGQRFTEWGQSEFKNLKNARLAAWGNYFDMPLLRKMYLQYGLNFPFSGTMIDVKSVAFAWMAMAGHRTDKLSIPHLVKLMGLTPIGTFHRALTDADITAQIYMKAMRELAEGKYFPNGNGKPYIYVRMGQRE